MADANAVEIALSQIEFARGYTLGLLAEIPEDRWFEIIPGMPTHVACKLVIWRWRNTDSACFGNEAVSRSTRN